MQAEQQIIILKQSELMPKLKQGRFSNMLSHHVSVSSQRAFSRQPFSRNKMFSKSPDPSAKKQTTHSKSVMIHNLPNLQGISQKNSVVLGKEKRQKIQSALQTARYNKQLSNLIAKQTSLKQYKKRIDPSRQQNQKNKKKTDHTLAIQAFCALRQRDRFNQFKNRITIVESHCHKLLREKQTRQQRLKRPHRGTKLSQNIAEDQKIVQRKKSSDQLMQIQNIIKIQEQSYFKIKRDNSNFNIFLLVKDPDNPMFFSGRKQLENCKFCFESIHQVNNKKLNESLSKGLSAIARLAAVKNSSKEIPISFRLYEDELAQAYLSLQSNHILQLANGQVLPEMLDRAITKDYEKKQSSENDERLIVSNLKSKQKNQILNFDQTHGNDIESYYYNQMRASKKEQEELQKQQQNKVILEGLMKEFVRCKENTVEDASVGKMLDQKTNELLRGSFDDLVLPSNVSKDQRINQYKRKKDKIENMKINLIREQVRKLKGYEKRLKQNRPKSKSKSKSKVKSKATQKPN